jgi:hypothetical protein
LPAHVAALQAEDLGRMFWKGKVFFGSQGILRNRIDDLLVLRPIIKDDEKIPKLTFDGETTWLLFPAALSCGTGRLDQTRRSIVIDYLEVGREHPAGGVGSDRARARRVMAPGMIANECLQLATALDLVAGEDQFLTFRIKPL